MKIKQLNSAVILFVITFLSFSFSGRAELRQGNNINTIDWEAENAFVDKNIKHAEKQYKVLISKMTRTDRFPRTIKDGNLEVTSGDAWTNGFFGGSLWYLYEYTKDSYWKTQAKKWTESLESVSYTANSHDVGFILFCSFGNGYRLEPSENSNYKDIIIRGSNALSNRFNSKVQCIKSWDWYSGQCPVIIDNMMNLEMLMWASKATANSSENQKFTSIGTQHADKTKANHLRGDYSSYHVVEYNTSTGNVIKQVTYQGWSDNSMWARGQGWGIYGYTMMYRETGDPKYLETAEGMVNVYLNHLRLPEDKIPWWDFNAGQPGYVKAFSRTNFSTVEYRDASAGAIVASALLELYTHTDNAKYLNAAVDMMHSLASDEYLAAENTNQGFLLKHCVGNFPGGAEIDVPLVYADYYFLEALLRYQSIIKKMTATEKPYRSIGYIPYWSTSCYTTLDYSALTHLNFAFCNPNTSGDLSAGVNDATLNAIIKKAHDNDVKVMASLGGAGYSANYPNLTSVANREMFCDKIIAYAKKYGFDGIDLDVEGEAAAAFWGSNYEAWVAALRTRCDAEGLLLTTAVGQWYADKITTKTFTYFDFITIMEYHRKANNYPTSITYYLNRGIKAKDLVLGVPFYGYRGNGDYVAYNTFMKENPDSWYFNTLNGSTWHNVKDIADIAQLSKNYSGIMIWELSQDVLGDYSLLKAVKSVLYGDGSLPQITNPVTSVSISPETGGEVMVGRFLQLSSSVLPANATVKSVTWSSSNNTIASVDGNGSVKGIKEGTVTITATSMNESKKATVTITVTPNPNIGKGDFPDVYGIISVYSNKAMDVKDKSLNSGARIQQWTLQASNNDNQRWLFEYVSDNTYYIRSKASGLYLTAMGIGNDGKVEQHDFRNNNTQQWDIVEVETGIYTIASKYSGRVLDVSGPSMDNGAEIHLWENLQAANQKWKFQMLEAGSDITETFLQSIIVFPNPTDGVFIIESGIQPAHFDLYSISGDLLKSGSLPQQSNQIDITGFNQGIYLLKISAGNDVYYGKMVKK